MGSKPFSNTMRIDLIPETPRDAADGRRGVVVSAPHDLDQGQSSHAATREERAASRYKDLLESIYDGVVITDYDGAVEEVNARAIDFLQYDAGMLGGVAITDLISGASSGLIKTLLENLKEDRFTLILAHCVRRNGSYFPAEIAVSRLEYGAGRLCFFVRDITVRRQAEEMLRTEHNALQNARAGIGIVNRGLELEYVNPAFASLCGYTDPKALTDIDLRDVLFDQGGTHARIEGVLDSGTGWEGSAQLKVTDGTSLAVRVAAAPNRNADGEIVGLVLSCVDLTDQQRADEAIREAERRRVMLESLGAACHHLGQPATVLTANLGLIRGRIGDDGSMVNQLVDSSLAACERLADILHKMNEVAEYRTTEYLAGDEHAPDGDRILQL